MSVRTVPRYCTKKANLRKEYFYTTDVGLINNPVHNARGFIGRRFNGFAHNGIFIPIAQMGVSFLLPCHFADHITQKELVPLFSVSMETDSAVRISDDTNTAVHLSEREKSFPLRDLPGGLWGKP
jgi:hypothetical protein